MNVHGLRYLKLIILPPLSASLLTELLMGLGVSPDTARADACQIEHDLSAETFDAIRKHAQQYR